MVVFRHFIDLVLVATGVLGERSVFLSSGCVLSFLASLSSERFLVAIGGILGVLLLCDFFGFM
jgi:hypothetical protein